MRVPRVLHTYRNQSAHFAQGVALNDDVSAAEVRERVRAALARRDFRSVREVARRARLSDNTVRGLLSGETTPDPATLAALDHALREIESPGEIEGREIPLADFLRLALAAVEAAEIYGVDRVSEAIGGVADAPRRKMPVVPVDENGARNGGEEDRQPATR